MEALPVGVLYPTVHMLASFTQLEWPRPGVPFRSFLGSANLFHEGEGFVFGCGSYERYIDHRVAASWLHSPPGRCQLASFTLLAPRWRPLPSGCAPGLVCLSGGCKAVSNLIMKGRASYSVALASWLRHLLAVACWRPFPNWLPAGVLYPAGVPPGWRAVQVVQRHQFTNGCSSVVAVRQLVRHRSAPWSVPVRHLVALLQRVGLSPGGFVLVASVQVPCWPSPLVRSYQSDALSRLVP